MTSNENATALDANGGANGMSDKTIFTASRILKAWEQRGIVKGGRERILICKLPGLAAIADDAPFGGDP